MSNDSGVYDAESQREGHSNKSLKLIQAITVCDASLKRKGLVHDDVQREDVKRVCIEDSIDEDLSKLEAKRAYNRANAARARKRTKDHITELCRKVESLSDRNETLEGKNKELTDRVSTLAEENKLLRSVLLDMERGARQLVAPSPGLVLPLLKQGNLGQGLGFASSYIQAPVPYFKTPTPRKI